MQRTWQLSEHGLVSQRFAPVRGPEQQLVEIGGGVTTRTYIRHRGSFWKLSRSLDTYLTGFRQRRRRAQQIRWTLIVLCLLGAIAVVVLQSCGPTTHTITTPVFANDAGPSLRVPKVKP